MGKIQQIYRAIAREDLGEIEDYNYAPSDDAPDGYNLGWKDGYNCAIKELYDLKASELDG